MSISCAVLPLPLLLGAAIRILGLGWLGIDWLPDCHQVAAVHRRTPHGVAELRRLWPCGRVECCRVHQEQPVRIACAPPPQRAPLILYLVGVCVWPWFCGRYYTDYAYDPVRSIARASTTGHGTNIIAGVAVGMRSTMIPVVSVATAVISAYWLGRTSGLGAGHSAGLFGTAVATMGMLSSAAFVLSMNNYGPIADNAGMVQAVLAPFPACLSPCLLLTTFDGHHHHNSGGIVEMSNQDPSVRDSTDKLDAAGNVTKAMTYVNLFICVRGVGVGGIL